MPHRRNIIEDEQRVKSISELPFSPLPHGVPGPWTDQVVREISNYFRIPPKSLPPQLIVQLGICEEGWPYIRRTTRTYHHFSPDKKNARKNLFGILFSFVPRRLLIRPSKWQEQPPPTANAQIGMKCGCLRWDFTAEAAFNLMKRRSTRQRSSREYTLIAPCALIRHVHWRICKTPAKSLHHSPRQSVRRHRCFPLL